MSALLVGEQFSDGETPKRLAPKTWARTSLRLGCFHDGVGRAKLETIGCRWDVSMNLLPPGIPWDKAFAHEVALLAEQLGHRRVILLGRKVAASFGIDWPIRWGILCWERFVVVPHPSGLNRVWNTLDRDALHQLMSCTLDERLTLRCCICTQPCRIACPQCKKAVCTSCWALHRPAHMGVVA